jgi:predicted nucleotidyltransferase
VTAYEQLLALAGQDHRILGVILSGSRGRGTGVSTSDWDCYAIVADGSAEDLQSAFDDIADGSLDLTVLAVTGFERYARPGTMEDWKAYAFVHVLVAHDRLGGGIADLAARKEALDAEVAEAKARRALDTYINAAVRSAKCRRDGKWAAAILDASESVGPALEAIFALHHRIRPYNRYLTWELERHPLSEEGVDDSWLPLVGAVPMGDVEASAVLFGVMEQRARANGIGDVFDAWEEGSIRLASHDAG